MVLSTAQDIAGQFVAYATALGLMVGALSVIKKAPAEARASEADAALKEQQRVQGEIDALEIRLRNARGDLDALRDRFDAYRIAAEQRETALEMRIDRLVAQVRAIGGEPVQ